MLVANFTLTTPQLQVLLAFRRDPDTRVRDHQHPVHDVDHTVTQLRKLTREGYLAFEPADRDAGTPPGYRLTPKGETVLALVEGELRRTLAWFEGGDLPVSQISGGVSAVATGKAEFNRKGVAVPKRKAKAS